MPHIQLMYRVPVYVTVDTDAETVDVVVVADDQIGSKIHKAFSDDGSELFLEDRDVKKAHEIAESEEWPGWDFG